MRRPKGWCIAGGLIWVVTAAGPAAADLSDPTRPPDYAAAPAADGAAAAAEPQRGWDLTSTLVSPSRRLAVINGRVVTPGARLGRMTVRGISSGRVVLEGEGRKQVLTLLGTPVTRSARTRRAAARGEATP